MTDELFVARTYATRAEWLAARKNSLGGSEVGPALFGKGYGSPLTVQAQKLGLIPDDEKVSLRFRSALALEETGAQDAAEKLQMEVVSPASDGQVIYHSRLVEHAHSTPDRFVVKSKPARIHARTLPAKSVCVLSLKNWSPSDKGAWSGDEVPMYALIQLQHEMMTLGMEIGRVHVMFGAGEDSLLTPEIEKHPGFHERLKNEIPAWWKRHITDRMPCPPVAEDADLLRQLYPRSKPGSFVILAGEEWQARYEQLRVLNETAKEAERAAKGLAVQFQDALKDVEYAVVDSGDAVSWKSHKRVEEARPARTIDVRAFRASAKVPKDAVRVEP